MDWAKRRPLLASPINGKIGLQEPGGVAVTPPTKFVAVRKIEKLVHGNSVWKRVPVSPRQSGGAGCCWRGAGAARATRGAARSPRVVAGEVLSLLQQWYTSSMNVVCTWLTDRMDLQLHIYQLKTLIRIVKVIV